MMECEEAQFMAWGERRDEFSIDDNTIVRSYIEWCRLHNGPEIKTIGGNQLNNVPKFGTIGVDQSSNVKVNSSNYPQSRSQQY